MTPALIITIGVAALALWIVAGELVRAVRERRAAAEKAGLAERDADRLAAAIRGDLEFETALRAHDVAVQLRTTRGDQ